jgi:hypothetical protein
MSKKMRWTTMSKLNVQKTGHTWKIRLIGEPEFSYAEELFRGLDAGKFTYRSINHSLKGKACRHWIISDTCVNPEADVWLVHESGVRAKGIKYLVNDNTGEIYAERNETITVMVYKNTTRPEIVSRKEVF